MQESLLQNLGELQNSIEENSSILEQVKENLESNSSESLLNHEDLNKINEQYSEHLSVFDEPSITSPSEHIEYPNGIPPYEIQAQIVFENYINSANRIMSGKEMRRMRRECLKNAKKGKYEYMFDKEKVAKREERMRKNFEKLNKS